MVKSFKKNAVRYTLNGVLLGAIFPLVAYMISAAETGRSVWSIFLHHNSILLYVIDTAPIFLGLLANFVGIKQDDIQHLIKRKARKEIELKNKQLLEAERVGRFGSCEVDLATEDVTWSEGLYALFDLDPEVCKASSCEIEKIIFQDDLDLFKQNVNFVMHEKRREQVVFQFRIIRKNRSIIWLKAVYRIMVDEAGVPFKMVGTYQDITDSKTQEETIMEQQQALMSSAKLSALGEMAGGVAHEVNTPLAVIQLRTEQLLECVDEGEIDLTFMRQSLESINETVKRIASIVRGLRIFARDGKKDPMVKTFVKQIVDDTLGLCREKFMTNNIEIFLDMDENMTIDCRATEISQVLLNLLNNSFDAIIDKTDKWIRIGAEATATGVQLSVTDCGLGIPEEIQKKLMQPFFTTKGVGKGTGIGLSISRGMIQSHGGSLYVDNKCDNTRFVISLPRKAGNASNHEDASHPDNKKTNVA